MKRLILSIGYLVLGASLLSSCIKDDKKECDSYVQFEYTYNLHYTDRFHKEASMVDLLLFDENGVYRDKITARADGTFPQGYRINLPGGLDKNMHMIAWTGIHADHFSVPALTPGQSTMEDVTKILTTTTGTLCSRELPCMMYGKVFTGDAQRSGIAYGNEVTTVSMMKNTNRVRIALQAKSNGIPVPLDKDEFSYRITVANGSYNYLNRSASDAEVVYQPYLTEENTSLGAVAAELSLLRFWDNAPLHLEIIHSPAGGAPYTLLDVDFKDYIELLRFAKYQDMPLQEFMDRQDEYELLLILTDGSVTPGMAKWICADVSINEFFLRLQGEDL